MIVKNEFPPNYKEIIKVFDLLGRRPVFTYGEIIYSPFFSDELDPDLLIHEKVHQVQQGADPKVWWDKYLAFPEFRLSQELEAYKMQFKFYKKNVKSWMPFLRRIANDLSGPMYGNIITFQEAMNSILKS